MYRFRNAHCIKRLISIRIVPSLTSEAIIVTMHILLYTIKASTQACFAFTSLTDIQFSHQCTTLHILVHIFWLSLSNKLSKVKIVSVLNYTKINHYMITLVYVFWNSVKLKLPQISKLHVKETKIQNIYQMCYVQQCYRCES